MWDGRREVYMHSVFFVHHLGCIFQTLVCSQSCQTCLDVFQLNDLKLLKRQRMFGVVNITDDVYNVVIYICYQM